MKKIGLWMALAALLFLGLAAAYFSLANLENQKKTVQEKMRGQIGIVLVSPEAWRWQFWPLGIRAGAVQLKNREGQPLLEAQQAVATLSPLSLFTGTPRVTALLLSEADIHVRRQENGGSNWQAVMTALANSAGSAVVDLSLQHSRLDIEDNQSFLDIDEARLQTTGATRWLQAQVSHSHLDADKQNFLLQSQVESGVSWSAANGFAFSNARIKSEISSTRLPGQLRLDTQGTLRWQQDHVDSQKLETVATYQNLGMEKPAAATFASAFSADLARGHFAFPGFALAMQPRSTLRLTGNGDLLLEDGQASLEKLRVQSLSTVEGKIFDWSLEGNAQATPEESRLQLQSTGDDHTTISATWRNGNNQPSLRLRLESTDIAALSAALGQSPVSGKISATLALQAGSLVALADSKGWQTAQGELDVTAENLLLPAYNPMRDIAEKLQGYASLLPSLDKDALQASATGPGHVARLQAHTRIADGVFTTRPLSLVLDKAQLQGGGQFNTQTQDMDYRFALVLNKSLFTHPPQAITVTINCQGNPEREQMSLAEALAADCKVADDAMKNILTKALRQRFLEH